MNNLSTRDMLFYDKLYKELGMGISRSAYAGSLLMYLKEFENEVKRLPNLSKIIPESYFVRVKKEILDYAHGSPIYRTKPPTFGPTKNYLYLLYKFDEPILKRIESCLSLLMPYIRTHDQKSNFKNIVDSLSSLNLSDFRSHLFELFVLGALIEHKVLIEPYHNRNAKNYDALIRIDKNERLIEITSLQESVHDLTKRGPIGVVDVPLAMYQPVRRIIDKARRGHMPDIFILALGDFASDVEAGWGIDQFISTERIKFHIFVIHHYLVLNGILFISPFGPVLSEKEKKFFTELR